MRITKQTKLEEKYNIADKIVEKKIVEAIFRERKRNPAHRPKAPLTLS